MVLILKDILKIALKFTKFIMTITMEISNSSIEYLSSVIQIFKINLLFTKNFVSQTKSFKN